MTSAYILIFAVLILGGLIAALGDHLGSKVGKAKLRLFDLRPRQTAIVLTVLTGTLIAASTLGILFTFSKSLREGIFRLDDILKQSRLAQADLVKAAAEKAEIEEKLKKARIQERESQIKQEAIQKRSKKLNENYNRALARLKQASVQAQKLQSDVSLLLKERGELVAQRQRLAQETATLQNQVRLRDEELKKREARIEAQDKILAQRQVRLQDLEKRFQALESQRKTLESQRQKLQAEINARDSRIDELDLAIALKDDNLKVRETKLKDLENQLSYLNREVQVLEQYYQNYQDLRERRIALVRGQVLAFAALRVVDPEGINDAIDELLRQANKIAIQSVLPPNSPIPQQPLVKITKAQVEQLSSQLQNGEDFVVRIISAGNYVQGETEIRVFADVAPNKLIFPENTTIATISMDNSDFSEEDIQKRLDLILSAAQFRARREGVLGGVQVEDGRIKTLIKFIEEISTTDNRPDEIRLVAVSDTYTVGPLKLRLIALKQGQIIFGS